MATQVSKMQTIYQDVLANYLISMARTVESSVESALDALLRPNLEAAAELSSKVFLVEPRVNEMEILIDDHAVRMLRTGLLDDEEIRRVVASQKIANDLERIGDLAYSAVKQLESRREKLPVADSRLVGYEYASLRVLCRKDRPSARPHTSSARFLA